MLGGQGRRDGLASEVWHLDLTTMVWEQASSARMRWQTIQSGCATMGSSKVCFTRFQPYPSHPPAIDVMALASGNSWHQVCECILC